MDKEKLKEKYTEYQVLIQQLQQIHQNIENIDKHIQDLKNLDENLSSITNIQTNQETLMAMGSGIFLKGVLKDNKNLIMNVGSNIYLEKTTDEARETLNRQLSEVTVLSEQMKEQVNILVNRIQELQQEFKQLKEE